MSSSALLRQTTVHPSEEDPDVGSLFAANGVARSYRHIVKRHFDSLRRAGPSALATQASENPTAAAVTHSLSANASKSSVPAPPLLPAAKALPTTYHAIQEWEGYVSAILDDEFEVILSDVSSPASALAVKSSLPLSDLTATERAVLRVGCIFRWTIGYERTPAGQRKRVSRIIFRQLPQWTEAELRASKHAAAELANKIVWE
jgi:hypothetical protein